MQTCMDPHNDQYPQQEGFRCRGLSGEISQNAATVMLASEHLKKILKKTGVSLDNEEMQLCFAAFDQSALRLSRAAENLDDTMAGQSDGLKPEIRTLDLIAHYAQMVRLCRKNPAMAQVELCFSTDAQEEYISTDPCLADKILLNLISNAARTASRVEILLKKQEEGLLLTVADNGPGLEEAIRNHLFEPFVTDHLPIQQGGGAGLGLHLVQEYCRALGWQLQLETGETGTRITMEIPRGENSAMLGSCVSDLSFPAEQERRVEQELSALIL